MEKLKLKDNKEEEMSVKPVSFNERAMKQKKLQDHDRERKKIQNINT